MGTVTGVMLVFAGPKNKAVSSHFSIQFLLFSLHVGFWDAYNPYLHEMGKKIYNTCLKKIVKYSHSLNSLLEMIFFPSVVIIRVVLPFLELLRNICLQIKSRSRFSLVHYFWSLASKIFLFLVMVTCLLLYYSILLNLSPTQTLAVRHSVPFYLADTVLILTLSALPCGFLAVSYLVISTTVGKSFDANSVYPTDLPLLFPSLNIFFGMLLIGYPCIKLVEYHHPGFCFGMVFRSKRFVTSILVVDVTGKSHSFTFAPHAMVFDLKSQINSKFKITSDLYWLSNKGKPLQHEFVPLREISAGAVIMNGRLTGGAECCLKGCENDVGIRKFDSLIGRYELKLSPQELTDHEDKCPQRVKLNPKPEVKPIMEFSRSIHALCNVHSAKKKCLSFQ